MAGFGCPPREAWAVGNKAGFYPYGKTRAQVFAEQE